jgi:hypothetical protein
MIERISSGRLCDDAIRAFDRLCALERSGHGLIELTPRQRSRRHLLEVRARAGEWLVPPVLAETAGELIAAADRIDDPLVAMAWTDHLPVAVLALLERRGMARRLIDGDPLLAGG